MELPATGGPTHRYLGSNAECWAVYGEVLAREYEDPALFGAAHRYTVDAYAAQHPDGQPAKSLVVHLVALHLLLERDADPQWVAKAMDTFITGGGPYPDLPRPGHLGGITVLDVLRADDPAGMSRRWAEAVWAAWSGSHDTISRLAAGL